MEALLDATKVIRFRISSLRPSKISERLVQIMKNERICPHLHISLQSASDKVLKLMNRLDYTSDDLVRRIKYFYKELEHRHPFIAADVIVGFPGEGDAEFKETLAVLNKIPMNKLHIFVFSPRPGTKAYDMKKENDNEVYIRRDALLEFSKARYAKSLNNMVGERVEVIWETATEGHSENYFAVRGVGNPNTLGNYIVGSVDEEHLCLLP